MLDSVALITGSALRTGRELALGLAKRGYNIAIHYNNSESQAIVLQRQIEQLGVVALLIRADLSIEASIKKLATTLQQQTRSVELLINNVGNYPRCHLMDTDYQTFQQLLATNIQAPLALIQALDKLLDRALIINIGCAAVEHNLVNSKAPAYQITKAALLNITKTLALELAPRNIRVNMISPGHLDNSVDLPKNPSQLPLKRVATVEDILVTIDYLITPNNYVTGANIDVGGGYAMGLHFA